MTTSLFFKVVVLLFVLLFQAGCGSSTPSTYRYEVSVDYHAEPISVNENTETAIFKSCNIFISEVNNNVFVVVADDGAINKYIENGHWLRIKGEFADMKRLVFYVP